MSDLQALLDEQISAHNVAGAALAVLDGGVVEEVASGVANVNTGVEATVDTVFQIGSTTKVLTATAIMGLVDEGRLDLDAPVREYIPEFDLADPDAAKRVSVRNLISMTSGIDNGPYLSFGAGDDCLARYLDFMRGVRHIHAPGAAFGYSNAGTVVAGRVIEKLTGVNWDAAMRRRLFAPAGMKHTVTLPHDVLLHRVALGHAPRDGALRVVPRWYYGRAHGPAGGTPCSTARDLVSFAAMHLNAGGNVLSAASVEAMQQSQVSVQPGIWAGARGWGLGWQVFDGLGRRMIGHDGGNICGYSRLWVFPDDKRAFALVCNTPAGATIGNAVATQLLERWDIPMIEPFRPPDESPDVDLDAFVGGYERLSFRAEIVRDEAGIAVRIGPTHGPMSQNLELKAVDERTMYYRAGTATVPVPFAIGDDGRASLMYTGVFACRRIA